MDRYSAGTNEAWLLHKHGMKGNDKLVKNADSVDWMVC